MTTSNALLQSLLVPPPAVQRDARTKGDGVSGIGGPASAQDRRGFGDLLSDLAVAALGTSPREPRAEGEPVAEAAALLSALKRGLIDAGELASGEDAQSSEDGDDADALALSSASPAIDASVFALRPAGMAAEGALPAVGGNCSDQVLVAQLLGAVAGEDPAAAEPRLAMPSSSESVSLAAGSPSGTASGGAPPIAPGASTLVTVTGQETHFAPVVAAPAGIESARLSAAANANAPDTEPGAAEGAGSDDGAELPDLDAENADMRRGALASQDVGARKDEGRGVNRQFATETQGLASQGSEKADDDGAAKTESATRVLERSDTAVRTEIAPSAAAQIARRVIAEAASAPAVGSAPAKAGHFEPTGRGAVVKVLEIEFEPASLGKVTIRMELKDDVLSLRLEAAHRDTIVVIENERDKLSNALRSAGYVVDAITAQTAEPLRGPVQGPLAATGAQSSPSSSDQTQAGLAHSQGGGGQQPPAGRGESPPPGGRVNEGPENPSARIAGALYV